MNNDERRNARPSAPRVTKKRRATDPLTPDQKASTSPALGESTAKTACKTVLTSWEPVATGGSQVVVLPAGVAHVQHLAAEGHNQRSIARALGIGLATLQRCIERQPELKDAYDAGRAEEEQRLVGDLKRASAKGIVIASMFLLKTRHGYREGDAPDQRPNIVINLPDAVSPDEYQRGLLGTSTAPALPSPKREEGDQ